jgi:hypothetical protein
MVAASIKKRVELVETDSATREGELRSWAGVSRSRPRMRAELS